MGCIPYKYLAVFLLLLCPLIPLMAQQKEPDQPEEEQRIEHADPVFEDLTTALGARKGENELNINFGYWQLKEDHHVFLSQLEYEFAPVDNLGFEVVLPYSVYFTNPLTEAERPANRLEYLQWGMQYSFYSSAKSGISLAAAFQNTLGQDDEFEPRNSFEINQIQYFPFLVAAKNWEDTFFLLFSGGPALNQDLAEKSIGIEYQLNTAFHYGFGEDDHYLGVEINKSLEEGDFEMMLRPQLILELSDNFILGSSIGFPVAKPDTRWTGFLRLAYEFK